MGTFYGVGEQTIACKFISYKENHTSDLAQTLVNEDSFLHKGKRGFFLRSGGHKMITKIQAESFYSSNGENIVTSATKQSNHVNKS